MNMRAESVCENISGPTEVFPPALLNTAIFRRCSKMEIARLMNYAAHRRIETGEVLFKQGDESSMVYWIEDGAVEISSGGTILSVRRAGFVGLDGVIGADHYAETATAISKTSSISFPRACLDALARNNTEILKKFFSAYRSHPSDQLQQASTNLGKIGESVELSALLGWLLVISSPLLIYFIGQQAGVDAKILFFSGIIIDSVLMWVFNLVPAFVPPLFSILAIILFDVASPKTALSGFSSGTFFMCLSIFGISSLMIKSGLAHRLSLTLLMLVPAKRSWYGFILFFLGALLTPVVPSRNGRTSIVGPFLVELLGMIKPGKMDAAATQFIVCALYGVTLMSPIFLTGSSLNLILYGMLDDQTRYTYQWLYWLYAAAVPGLLLFGAYVFLSGLFFRFAHPVQISKDMIREQRKLLGPMSGLEIVTLLTLLSLAVLIPTLKIHKVDIPWLLLTISTVLLIFGMIGQKEFRSEIDWPILIFIGAILAWTPVISEIGLDSVIANSLSGVGEFMKSDFYWFVALLSGALMIARLFLPVEAAVIIFATITLPIAIGAGLSPWPIAFILLLMSEATLFPYQNLLRLQVDGVLAQHDMPGVADDSKVFRLDLMMVALRLAVIYASIPFWKYMNVV